MARFLAVYTMQPEAVTAFRAMPKEQQDAVDAKGIRLWADWLAKHEAAILDPGHMVGKTTRISRTGIGPATNPLCGYLVIEAPSPEAAAEMFRDHPHLTCFPGDGVDIMPLVT